MSNTSTLLRPISNMRQIIPFGQQEKLNLKMIRIIEALELQVPSKKVRNFTNPKATPLARLSTIDGYTLGHSLRVYTMQIDIHALLVNPRTQSLSSVHRNNWMCSSSYLTKVLSLWVRSSTGSILHYSLFVVRLKFAVVIGRLKQLCRSN